MDEQSSFQHHSRGLYLLAAVMLCASIFGLMAIVPWIEQVVIGSHRVGRFYHDTGIDIPFTWIANTCEWLFGG